MLPPPDAAGPGDPGDGPAPTAADASGDATALPAPPRPIDRVASLVEVLLCSGFPTQLLVMVALAAAGLPPLLADGSLSLRYVTVLSLVDTALVLVLILAFLRARGERLSDVFLGARPVLREAWLGLLLVPVVFGIVAGQAWLVARFAPWLRDVPDNPFASLLRNARDVALFAFVAVVAGGAREELQRAFVLRRFEQHLGGAALGLVLFSAAFGLGHLLQGRDAAIMTASMGLVWGCVYLTRHSAVAPLVCHAAFNLLQVVYHGLSG